MCSPLRLRPPPRPAAGPQAQAEPDRPPGDGKPVIVVRDLVRKFGDFTANNRVNLTVEPHQIHCLLGENGAGKSTLMNVLYGLHQPDAGEILIDDEPVTFSGRLALA